MAKLEKGSIVSDFLVHYESAIVCFESGSLTSPGALDGFDPVGQPVIGDPATGYTLATDLETFTGWVISKGPISGDAASVVMKKALILVRGPGAINKNSIPAKDYAGDDLTLATQVAALEAAGLVIREESPSQDEQTT